jgi:hypothetical protein
LTQYDRCRTKEEENMKDGSQQFPSDDL